MSYDYDMKGNSRIKYISEFSWTKKDFINSGEEIPEVLENDSIHPYGELLSESEIIEWILETSKVFRVLKEAEVDTYEMLYTNYLIDLQYLTKIGKIKSEKLPELEDILNIAL